jgi:hypothetical protein
VSWIESLSDSQKLGAMLGLAAIAALACFLVLRLFRWYRFLREFRLAQISAEELNNKLKLGDQILLLDLQGSDKLLSEALAIPGSIRMDPRRLESYITQHRGVDLRAGREVILYGASCKDSTSAHVALALRRVGFEESPAAFRGPAGMAQSWLSGHPQPTYCCRTQNIPCSPCGRFSSILGWMWRGLLRGVLPMLTGY